MSDRLRYILAGLVVLLAAIAALVAGSALVLAGVIEPFDLLLGIGGR